MSSNSEKSFLNFPGHFWKEVIGSDFHQDTHLCKQTHTHTHTHTHSYLPGLVEAADSCCVQTHDDGKCRVQISLGFTTTDTQTRSWRRTSCLEILPHLTPALLSVCISQCVFLLSSDLDELLEQLHSLVERYTHQNLGHDPLLDLVAALEQNWERRRVAGARSPAEGVVHQLLLHVEGGDITIILMECLYVCRPFSHSSLFFSFSIKWKGTWNPEGRLQVKTSDHLFATVDQICQIQFYDLHSGLQHLSGWKRLSVWIRSIKLIFRIQGDILINRLTIIENRDMQQMLRLRIEDKT